MWWCSMPPRQMNRRGNPPTPPQQNSLTALEQACANMMTGITALLEQHAARPRLTHDEDVAERFQKKGPKEFSGSTDPLVAEGWIRSLETIFAYMGLTDADKVKCAVYMMKDDAALWWEGAVRGVNPQTLTWEEFKQMFFAKYFTEDVRSRMIREFMSLRQEDKTVVEYIKQFERGCHFVPLIADSAEEKMRQFVDGLKADIKHDVRMMDVTTYEAAVSRALRSEDGRKEILREQQRKRQFQPSYHESYPQQDAKKQSIGLKGPNPPRQQGSIVPRAEALPLCLKCQKPHPGPCMKGSGMCYHCKEPGHIMLHCSKKNAAGRVYVMQAEEAVPDTLRIMGNFI
ncbi:uncharacterized protein [Henckelia pumila]|uniref:uncharacterized protein n=1 Tax=Henckelia pumila TaxID=405737 RepID=UPI003C6E2A92